VDPEERLVVVWTAASPEPAFVIDVLRWRPKADVPALEIPLATIFGPAPAPATP